MSKITIEKRDIESNEALERLLMRLFSKGGIILEEKDGYVVIMDSKKKIHVIGYFTAKEEKELIARYAYGKNTSDEIPEPPTWSDIKAAIEMGNDKK